MNLREIESFEAEPLCNVTFDLNVSRYCCSDTARIVLRVTPGAIIGRIGLRGFWQKVHALASGDMPLLNKSHLLSWLLLVETIRETIFQP